MLKAFTRYIKISYCLIPVLLAFYTPAIAQISLTPYTNEYQQDFNTLPASTESIWESGASYIPGWFLYRTIPEYKILRVGTGTSNGGGVYSFGAKDSPDRALGAVSSGSSTVGEFAWGLMMQNNTMDTITSLTVSYMGEQWRSSSSTAPQQSTTFWYASASSAAAFNLNPKSDNGWTSVPSLDITSPVFYTAPGPLNGNAPENRRYLSALIELHVLPGHFIMLRWKDLNDLFDDHGLAIDDFRLSWKTKADSRYTIMPVELLHFKATPLNQAVRLNWATASEKDNSHFIVERSQNSKTFHEISSIAGKGTIATKSVYTYTDEDPAPGINYYRLKQVDFDGTYTYSKTINVNNKQPAKAILYPTITSGQLRLELTGVASELVILDMTGRQVHKYNIAAKTSNYSFDVSRLKAGSYMLALKSSDGSKQVMRFEKI